MGSRRWAELALVSEDDRHARYPSLEELMPDIYRHLLQAETTLENHFNDMQDLEFTIQEGKLWMLQTRNGKRTGTAMVRIAMEMLQQGMIDEKTALLRVSPDRLDELLHPIFDPQALKASSVIARGLPASPGAASGQIVFFADEAEEWVKQGKAVILVRQETSPEDLRGMSVAKGILTARGGMTSHAAVVARGMGKCCVSGAGAVHVDTQARTMTIGNATYDEGEWLSLNGSTGEVFAGRIATKDAELSGDFGALMALADRYKRLEVRTNADTPDEAKVARHFGATGIGLCRTEHMFFERRAHQRGTRDDPGRRRGRAPQGAGEAAADAARRLRRPVPRDERPAGDDPPARPAAARVLAARRRRATPAGQGDEGLAGQDQDASWKICTSSTRCSATGAAGWASPTPRSPRCRRAPSSRPASNMQAKGFDVKAEIMVPLVGTVREFNAQAAVIRKTGAQVFAERGETLHYLLGTMIETPRAALVADSIGKQAEFFSFGTNDLTQMTMGFSRDDAGKFLPEYLKRGMYEHDPFRTIDQKGVGLLVEMAVQKGRSVRPGIEVGVCGEHGGDPASVAFFHRAGLDYVSCSPFRVPIARLAAAQAALGT